HKTVCEAPLGGIGTMACFSGAGCAMSRLILPLVVVILGPAACGGADDAEPDQKAVDKSLGRLRMGDAKERRLAAEELGEARSQAARVIPALARALHDPNRGVRKAAADALVRFGEDSVWALADMLNNKNKQAACAAALALGDLGPKGKGAVSALSTALKDPDIDL